MVGRTPPEAVQNYLWPLQRAISCVSEAVLNVRGGYYPASDPHPLAMAGGAPARLSSNPPIFLSVLQNYRIVENEGPQGLWRVDIASYYYSLEDTEGGEILYHWHPQGTSAVTFPHPHVRIRGLMGSISIDDTHLPTGKIALEDVLGLAIRELGVRPRRPDWEAVLSNNESA